MILGNAEDSVKQAVLECERLLGGERSDGVLAIFNDTKSFNIRDYFQIGEEELNAIAINDTKNSREDSIIKAVLNRIALVALEK